MSRLDKHVAAVQNKLTMIRFTQAAVWTINVFVGLVILAILIQRILALHLPHAREIFWGGLGASFVVAISWAFATRPSAKYAAVAIDEKLGLKEKLSTALFMRTSDDPFAQAAVKDAEQTASNVAMNLRQHFPMQFPRRGYLTVLLAAIAFCTGAFLPQMDLFGKEEKSKQQVAVDVQRQTAERAVKQALAAVEAVPKSLQNDEAVKNAKITLQNLMNQPIKDPARASRTALQAAQEVQEALKKEAMTNQKYAIAQNEMKMMKNYMPPPDEKGPVADAQREIARGDFTEAMKQLNELTNKFDQMDKKDQEKAAQQMQNLAKQMQQQAQQQQSQQQQQQNQQQLQQMGANQQQAQQMQQLMQQAAQGNQQAQQQLQQQAQQMMQQMNNGQGPTQQQQQQMQQAMAQMQAQANNAATAAQMAQAAQAMAQAMQQAGQNGGQAGNQQQQMANAAQQMQQAMQQMDATASDAQQIAAAQQAMQDAADQAAGQCNGDGDGQQANAQGGKNGQWKDGDPNKQGKGFGGPGQATGGRPKAEQAPYGVKEEISKSPDNQKGKLLASNYVKDNQPIKGEAKENLKKVAEAAEHDAAEEVDTDRVSRQASKAVKDYFGSLADEQPAPASSGK